MSENKTIIKKPNSFDEPKVFCYDYAYWSHDGFKVESNGYHSPTNSKYADQVCFCLKIKN